MVTGGHQEDRAVRPARHRSSHTRAMRDAHHTAIQECTACRVEAWRLEESTYPTAALEDGLCLRLELGRLVCMPPRVDFVQSGHVYWTQRVAPKCIGESVGSNSQCFKKERGPWRAMLSRSYKESKSWETNSRSKSVSVAVWDDLVDFVPYHLLDPVASRHSIVMEANQLLESGCQGP